MDEYLELKEELGPLEKRLGEVRDRPRDLVTEHGHFVDEVRGVAVHVEPRFRKEYDAERLVAVFPRLAGCMLPLFELPGIVLPGKRRFRKVFDLHVDLNLSFVDAYHAVLMRQLGLNEIVTFDKQLDRVPGVKRRAPNGG